MLLACVAARVAADDSAAPTGHVRLAQSSDVKRRIEAQRHKMEQRRKEIEAEVRRRGGPTAKSLDDLKKRAAVRSFERPKPPPFDATRASPPEKALLQYIRTARSATSMEQLMGFLPDGEQKGLKSFQSGYDPALAAQRRAEHRREGRLDEDSITHLTNSPYANSLKHHRGIAKKFIAVLRVDVEGNKAEIEVSTHSEAVVDGVRYPYSTARYELVGEGTTWRIGRYADGPLNYREPPARRPEKPKQD